MFVDALMFMLLLGGNGSIQVPQAYMSQANFTLAITKGLHSWQSLGFAAILFVFILIGVAFTAYTKSLVLGVMRDASEGERTNILGMFRAGRQYWWSVIRYYVPFTVLGIIALFLYLPLVVWSGYYLVNNAAAPQVPSQIISIVVALALFLVLRALTITADAVIVDGSKRPIKDSLQLLKKNPARVLSTTALLVAVAIIMVLINAGLNRVGSALLIFEILAFVILVAWRLWATGFVVSLWHGKTRGMPAPRQR